MGLDDLLDMVLYDKKELDLGFWDIHPSQLFASAYDLAYGFSLAGRRCLHISGVVIGPFWSMVFHDTRFIIIIKESCMVARLKIDKRDCADQRGVTSRWQQGIVWFMTAF